MTALMRCLLITPKISVYSRTLSCSQQLYTKQWRVDRGLPINRNAEGVLTDAPDYTYLDGRPTPLLHKQKIRMLRNQEYAAKIVELCSELQYAKQRYQDKIRAEEDAREAIIKDRLKPKGRALKGNK